MNLTSVYGPFSAQWYY